MKPIASAAPPIRMRIIVALAAAIFGAVIVNFHYDGGPDVHTDFGMVWYGARAVLEGRDPYALIGPGLEFDYTWKLLYPVPALIAAMPLAWLSERLAATLFVSLSAGLLAFGITRSGWHLLPLLVTEAFVSSARLGQWSMIITASLFFPALALLAGVKPQASLPILVASRSSRIFLYALAGAALLTAASFALLPSWVIPWMENVRAAPPMIPPVTTFGGFLVLLVLIRWRRPESWLIASLACMPQSVGWYGTLPLLTIPATIGESLILAGTSALGAYLGGFIMPEANSIDGLFNWTASLIVITVYLPAVIMVLRRPNDSEPPAWVAFLIARWRSRTSPKE